MLSTDQVVLFVISAVVVGIWMMSLWFKSSMTKEWEEPDRGITQLPRNEHDWHPHAPDGNFIKTRSHTVERGNIPNPYDGRHK
jgi:hypothetical protein